jgi:hypothetical protein
MSTVCKRLVTIVVMTEVVKNQDRNLGSAPSWESVHGETNDLAVGGAEQRVGPAGERNLLVMEESEE